MFRVVIPARYASTRLPGKALMPLAGKPMIQWVYECASRSKADEILVATDDSRIAGAVRGFGAPVVMTSAAHRSATDRIAEVAQARGWAHEDIVVNVQGDEPLMPPALIDQVATVLAAVPQAGMATLARSIESLDDFLNPNVVKVVADNTGRALYFSRAPIPWDRDAAPSGLTSQQRFSGARRHIGLYAYRVAALERLAALPPSPLETCEKLEQLRALSNGMGIWVAEACEPPGEDVNTPEDLKKVAARLSGSGGWERS